MFIVPDKERDEREQFAVEACYLMRDRFLSKRSRSGLAWMLKLAPVTCWLRP